MLNKWAWELRGWEGGQGKGCGNQLIYHMPAGADAAKPPFCKSSFVCRGGSVSHSGRPQEGRAAVLWGCPNFNSWRRETPALNSLLKQGCSRRVCQSSEGVGYQTRARTPHPPPSWKTPSNLTAVKGGEWSLEHQLLQKNSHQTSADVCMAETHPTENKEKGHPRLGSWGYGYANKLIKITTLSTSATVFSVSSTRVSNWFYRAYCPSCITSHLQNCNI